MIPYFLLRLADVGRTLGLAVFFLYFIVFFNITFTPEVGFSRPQRSSGQAVVTGVAPSPPRAFALTPLEPQSRFGDKLLEI